MASSTMNGGSSTGTKSTAAALGDNTQQQGKASYSGKVTEGGRKVAAGTSDNPQKRSTPQKAWQSGVNPITQRSNTPQQNGISSSAKSSPQKETATSDVKTSDRNVEDRQRVALGRLVGLLAKVFVNSGDVFTGIYLGSTVENNGTAFSLLMARHVGSAGKVDEKKATALQYAGVGENHAMTFNFKDVVEISIPEIGERRQSKKQNGGNPGFRTDAEITGNMILGERELQPWQPDEDVDMSLESTSNGTWDQFKANEERFGVKSTYDENLYTTTINKSNPLYKMREAEAARLAREIEASGSDNAHMREERGLEDQETLGEEDKYSGVRRKIPDYPPLSSNKPNAYTPPARRVTSTKPAASSASVDPAIISSQVARSGNNQDRQSNEAAAAPAPGPSASPNELKKPEGQAAGSKGKVSNSKGNLPIATGKAGGSATENVETELLDSFRQFANMEKMRVQDSRRNRISADKTVKLNDLMKFSKNFKLLTPVPKDLVPILAKDKSKQNAIMEKAQKNAEQAAASPIPQAGTIDSRAPKIAVRHEFDAAASSSERPALHFGRVGQPISGSQTVHGKDRNNPLNGSAQSSKQAGMLSRRLEDNQRALKAGVTGPPISVPAPLPIHDAQSQSKRPSAQTSNASSPQKANGVRSPTSAVSAKFNVKAMEFRPNPAASSFKPITDASLPSSPKPNVNDRSASRALSPSDFFGKRKPLPPSDRPSILVECNPLKFLKKEAELAEKDGKKTKDYDLNGGIRPAHRTPPTWNPPKEGEDYKSYKDMFEEAAPAPTPAAPSQSSPANNPLPHQHQLPLHLQSGSQSIPHLQTSQQMPPQMHAHQQHYGNGSHQYDDHRMRPSASSSSVYPSPSPRMQPMTMAYPASPMGQHAQLAYGQPVPQYVMGPNGPQPAQFRQYSSGPQMVASQGPHLAAPMVVQQPGGGAYMNMPQAMGMPYNPQMPMYPGGAPQSYGGPSQPPSGYPSPGRAAPMMMHQGSHQGQHPQMYVQGNQYGQPMYAQQQPAHMTPMRGGFSSPQPSYNSSPHQPQHFPHQPHRAPSGGYGQMPQVHHQQQPQQGPPASTPMAMGQEDGKG